MSSYPLSGTAMKDFYSLTGYEFLISTIQLSEVKIQNLDFVFFFVSAITFSLVTTHPALLNVLKYILKIRKTKTKHFSRDTCVNRLCTNSCVFNQSFLFSYFYTKFTISKAIILYYVHSEWLQLALMGARWTGAEEVTMEGGGSTLKQLNTVSHCCFH